MGKICPPPLVGIGLTELPNSMLAKSNPAHRLTASLQFVISSPNFCITNVHSAYYLLRITITQKHNLYFQSNKKWFSWTKVKTLPNPQLKRFYQYRLTFLIVKWLFCKKKSNNVQIQIHIHIKLFSTKPRKKQNKKSQKFDPNFLIIVLCAILHFAFLSLLDLNFLSESALINWLTFHFTLAGP